VPLPSSPAQPTNALATCTPFLNPGASTSAPAAIAVPPPPPAPTPIDVDAPPAVSSSKKRPASSRTQRDRDGPAIDVASALNAAFGTNARAGAYYAGQLHRDGVEDGVESDDSDNDDDDDARDGAAAADTGSRKKRKGDTKNKGKEKALPAPTPATTTQNADGGYITTDQVMMGSLRNKNKKKGFKLSMANPIPRKIVFAVNDGVGANANASADTNPNPNPNQQRRDAEDEKEVEASMVIDVDVDEPHSYDHPLPHLQSQSQLHATNGLPRLIPPSEIQERGELPPNMFVTSVDVEADVWGAGGASTGGGGDTSNSKAKKKNKKRKKEQEHDVSHSYTQPEDQDQDEDDTGEFHYPPDDHSGAVPDHNKEEEEGLWLLDYPEAVQPSKSADKLNSNLNLNAAADASNSNENKNKKFDWVKAEKNWDTSFPLTRVEQVEVGSYVCWKVGFFHFFSFLFPSYFLAFHIFLEN